MHSKLIYFQQTLWLHKVKAVMSTKASLISLIIYPTTTRQHKKTQLNVRCTKYANNNSDNTQMPLKVVLDNVVQYELESKFQCNVHNIYKIDMTI